jgi:hypothetical protein
MNPLERELKDALRRQEPSADFVERVMAQLPPAHAGRRVESPAWREALRNIFRVPALRWASAAALCLALVISVVAYQRYEQKRREGEMARAQVMLALRIASAKFNGALRQVKHVDGAERDGTPAKSGRGLEHL